MICFCGGLVLWLQETLDGDGFRVHVLYGFVLALLGVATPLARPRLMKRLHELQRELTQQTKRPGVDAWAEMTKGA